MSVSLGDLTQIPVTTQPTQGLPKLGDVSVTLYNQDITNLVYVSYQQWFTPGAGNCIPIQPLTSITISAKRAIYVAALVTNVQPLMVMPEGSQAQPSPAQIATQINALGLAKETTQVAQSTTIPAGIAATGVPLLLASDLILDSGAQILAPGGVYLSGTLTMTQPMYEIYVIAVSAGTTDATPWFKMQLLWNDSNTALNIDEQDFGLGVANLATPSAVYHGIGPVHGNQLRVDITNLQTTFNGTFRVVVLSNSKTGLPELWKSENVPTINGQTNPSSFPFFNVLALDSASIAGGGNRVRQLPLYAGLPINLRGNTASNTTDLEITVRVPSSLRAALGFPQTTPEFYDYNSDSHGLIQQTFNMPRVMLEYIAVNHNAAAETVVVNINAEV